MKKLSAIVSICLYSSLLVTSGCKKEPGPGGKAHIHGGVEIEATGQEIPNNLVEIWYGATSASGQADANATTDATGQFEFENLTKGDYFLSTSYIDTSGTLLSGSASVTISKKSGEVEAHLHLE